MDINDRIFKIMKKKGIKNNALAEKLNVKPQIITNWKTRGTTPPMEYLPTICKVLGVSWEYLITGEESTMYTTPDEDDMIMKFRMLPNDAQKEMKSYLDYQLFKIKHKGEQI